MSEFISRIKFGSAIPWIILFVGAVTTVLVYYAIEYRSNSFSEQRIQLIGQNVKTIIGNSLEDASPAEKADSTGSPVDLQLLIDRILKNDSGLVKLVEKEAFGVTVFRDPNLSEKSLIASSAKWDPIEEYRSFVFPLVHNGELLVVRVADLNKEIAIKYRIRTYIAISVVAILAIIFFLLTYSYIRKTTLREEKVNEMLKNMANTEEKFKAILDAVPDAVLIVDAKSGLIEAMNQQVSLQYGYSPEELLNKDYTILSVEPEKSRASLRAMQRTVPKRLHKKKDGTVFSAEIKLGTVTLEDETKVVSVIRDIEERLKRDEEISHSLNKEKALRELREQQIASSSFTLRTPLSIVLSSIDILENYSDKLSTQEKEYHFGQVRSNIESLLKMLEEPTKNHTESREREIGSE